MSTAKSDIFLMEASRPALEELPSLVSGVQATKEHNFPHVVANYLVAEDPRMAGNILVEALPRMPQTREGLMDLLTVCPEPLRANATRMMRVAGLPQFLRSFFPVPRVGQLAERVWTRMTESYIGRQPYSKAYGERMQMHYESSTLPLTQLEREAALKNCIALVGLPGAGKSHASAHISRLYPPIIHHPAWSIWQIPVIRVVMPYKARSEHAFAIRIIRAIAQRYPEGRYIELFLSRRPPHVDTLVDMAIHLIHKHCVGLIVVDDGHKSEQDADGATAFKTHKKRPADRTSSMPRLLDMLFWCVDTFGIPLLLVATTELKVTLDETLSGLRRTIGGGLQVWNGLNSEVRPGHTASDLDVFLALAWKQLVIPQPPQLEQTMRNALFFYSYALPDVMMSLLHDIQAQVLEDGLKTFDLDLVHEIANSPAHLPVTELCRAMHYVKTDAAARAKLQKVKELAAAFNLQPDPAIEPPSVEGGALFEFAQMFNQQRRSGKRKSSQQPATRSKTNALASSSLPAARANHRKGPKESKFTISSFKEIGQ